MNPGLFLLPGPHLCLTAFLFFPWAILDLQPKPSLAEVCNALSHPGYYPLPFAFLLAHYFRHFGLEKCWFPFHQFSPAWPCWCIMARSSDWAAPPEKVVADLKVHLATGWPLFEPPRRSFLRMLPVHFSQWLLTGSPSAALGAGPADGTPCTSPGICPMKSFPAYPLLSSLRDAQHQQKGGRKLQPGWASGLKVKAHCEGPDPPGCGSPRAGITHPWSTDQQVVVQTESFYSAPAHFQRELPTETALGSASPDVPWDLAWSSWGFLLRPQPTSSSYGLEQELPLSPDSWSTYFHAYKHLEMFHSLHW